MSPARAALKLRAGQQGYRLRWYGTRRWEAAGGLLACSQPQVVTKRGVEPPVPVPIDQWRRLEKMTKPNLKDLLLAPEARIEALVPPRKRHSHRAAPAFE